MSEVTTADQPTLDATATPSQSLLNSFYEPPNEGVARERTTLDEGPIALTVLEEIRKIALPSLNAGLRKFTADEAYAWPAD